MVVVHRACMYRCVIYTADNEPTHVHMTGPGQAKTSLPGPDGEPELVWSVAFKRTDRRRLLSEGAGRRSDMLKDWERIAVPVASRTETAPSVAVSAASRAIAGAAERSTSMASRLMAFSSVELDVDGIAAARERVAFAPRGQPHLDALRIDQPKSSSLCWSPGTAPARPCA